MVNAPLKTDCFLLLYRRFPVTKQRVDWCLLEFSFIYFVITARLVHGIQVVFQYFLISSNYKTTHSLEFSGSFLACSRTVNARKMPENRLFFTVHQLVNARKHGVFLEENRDVFTYRRTLAPFLHLQLLHFDGILHALWNLLGGVASNFCCFYVFLHSEFAAVPPLYQWLSYDSILSTEGLDSLHDYVLSNKI